MAVAPAVAQEQSKFKLLATNRTGTMQRELDEAPPEFNYYAGMTVFECSWRIAGARRAGRERYREIMPAAAWTDWRVWHRDSGLEQGLHEAITGKRME